MRDVVDDDDEDGDAIDQDGDAIDEDHNASLSEASDVDEGAPSHHDQDAEALLRDLTDTPIMEPSLELALELFGTYFYSSSTLLHST